jgi:hypothetical protein
VGREPCKEEKERLKLQIECKPMLKPLEIYLDDDGIDCHFSNGKCKILVNNECVGLAFRQDKLYLLSLDENANNACDENMNDSHLRM